MRSPLRHKWAVSVAAIVLVLAFAAVALAQTGGTTPTTTPNVQTPGNGGMGGFAFGFGGRHGGMFKGRGGAMGQQWQQFRQQQKDAVLKLVRDKMSAADQKKFDDLLGKQKAQQDQLQKDREALQSTNQQLRDMVQKTLGVTPPTTSTTNAPGTTSQ